MMSAMLRLACAGLACLVLASCGGGGGSGGSTGSDRQQITNLYKATFAALARGDYAAACSYFTAKEQAKVVTDAHRVGLQASSCADTFTALINKYKVPRSALAKTFGAAGKIVKVRSISIHGDKATVTFTSTSGGQSYTETDALVREGGKWKADRILKRSQSG
jgi:hypothetical protein